MKAETMAEHVEIRKVADLCAGPQFEEFFAGGIPAAGRSNGDTL
jgi:hypothetical protein